MQKNNGANCDVDAEYINLPEFREHPQIHFQSMFPWNSFCKRCIIKQGPDEQNHSNLQAILIIISVAFMNVEDMDGDTASEIVPFLERISADEQFLGSLHKMSILLYGMALNLVRFLFLEPFLVVVVMNYTIYIYSVL